MNRRERLAAVVGEALATKNVDAVVHVGPAADQHVRYCQAALERPRADGVTAFAFAPDAALACGPETDQHPATALAKRLQVALPGAETLATPLSIPHDAALHLESAGFALTSSDALERARERKTPGERERIACAQRAASAGVRRARSLLADASVGNEGALAVDGEALTASTLRRAVDAAIVRADGFPCGRTRVIGGDSSSGDETPADDPLRAGDPIRIAATPREPTGYHGHLERTLVVDGEGGWERRAQIALEGALTSARALATGEEPTVAALEADLAAEVRAFGFDEGIETAVSGIGLEPIEAPRSGDVPTDAVCRFEVSATGPTGGRVALADVLERGAAAVGWLEASSRSLAVE